MSRLVGCAVASLGLWCAAGGVASAASADDPRVEVEMSFSMRNGGACPLGMATSMLMSGAGAGAIVGLESALGDAVESLGPVLQMFQSAQGASGSGTPPSSGGQPDPMSALLMAITAPPSGGSGAAPALPPPPKVPTSTGEMMTKMMRGAPDTSWLPLATTYQATIRATLRPSDTPGVFVVERGSLRYHTASKTRLGSGGAVIVDRYTGGGTYDLKAGSKEVTVTLKPSPEDPARLVWSLDVDVKHRARAAGTSLWLVKHEGSDVLRFETRLGEGGREDWDIRVAGKHASDTGTNVFDQGVSWFVHDQTLVAQSGSFSESYVDVLGGRDAARARVRVMKSLQAVIDVRPFEIGTKARLDGSRSRGKIEKYEWKIRGDVPLSGPCAEGAEARTKQVEVELPTTQAQLPVTILGPVDVTLEVTDATGQTDTSEPLRVTPSKRTLATTCDQVKAVSYDFLAPHMIAGSGDTWRCATCLWGMAPCSWNVVDGSGFEARDHWLHHRHGAPGSRDWEAGGDFAEGFVLEQVTDDRSPFDGFWYVASQKLTVKPQRIVNQFFGGNAVVARRNATDRPPKGLTCGGQTLKYDLARAVRLTEEHEQIHVDLALAACRGEDPARRLEPMIDTDHDTLAQNANTCVGQADTNIVGASSDVAVKAALARRHGTVPLLIELPEDDPGSPYHPVCFPDFIGAASD